MISTKELARGKWFSILTHFGIDAKYLKKTHGPCPCCGGKNRFKWDNLNGDGSHHCNQCGAGRNGFALLEKFTGRQFKDLATEVDKFLGANQIAQVIPINDKSKTIARIKRIGYGLKEIQTGDLVHQYLNSRGVTSIPSDFIKKHPSLDYWHDGRCLGQFPAMVCAFKRPDGSNETYHITHLTSEGKKADVPSVKKIPGTTSEQGLKGCAIRLSPVTKHIGITEGVETALSVKELYGINCWASATANNLMEFRPPKGVEEVTIYPDIDESFTGQASAYNLAKRLRLEGIKVNMAEHLPMGKDYNDLLVEVKHGRTA